MNRRHFALLAAAGLIGLSATTPASANDPGWVSKVSKLIDANFSYPRSAQLRGEEGRARIKIAVAGDGKVLSVSLLQSSGSAILDREAVRIPMKVGSFPAPPNRSNTEIVFPITWRIAD